jgi:hypothetical protein
MRESILQENNYNLNNQQQKDQTYLPNNIMNFNGSNYNSNNNKNYNNNNSNSYNNNINNQNQTFNIHGNPNIFNIIKPNNNNNNNKLFMPELRQKIFNIVKNKSEQVIKINLLLFFLI